MYEFVTILIALGTLAILLRLKVKLGLSMLITACVLGLLLRASPQQVIHEVTAEWHKDPLTHTTVFLFISLTALLLLVNVLGAAMEQIGLSQRLVPAMQGLFRSRRLALAMIPLMMGMLPTPGGIMLSAPMVREAGDKIGISRSRLAAINFFFRHQWEPVWPLFPAIPLIQGLLGVSALTLLRYHIALTGAGIFGGVFVLLMFGIPPRRRSEQCDNLPLSHSFQAFAHAFWPIAFTAGCYIIFDLPPAIGIFLAIVGLLFLHKVPLSKWRPIFRAGREPDMVLLIFGALLFKLILQASGAIGGVVQFFVGAHMPPCLLLFLLPMLVSFATGVTMPTVAITYPFLLTFIGTGSDVRMGREVLAFSGLLFGLWLTPVHLCVALSASYFESSLLKIIIKLFLPAAGVVLAGILMFVFFG
jgi:integral membrane protein (TIGR00529 family)